MSRNIGHVIFHADSSIKYMIYNGTTEQCYPELYNTYDEAIDAFDSRSFGVKEPSCTCCSTEPVTIIPYDSSPVKPENTIHWTGTACRKCRCICSGLYNPKQPRW